MKLYEILAETLQQRIEQGFYLVGTKLPSVRQLSTEHQVSIATAQQALWLLEQQNWVEVRPKSGFYVKVRKQPIQMPQVSRFTQYPVEVSQWPEVLQLLSNRFADGMLNLGRGICDLQTSTLKPVQRLLADMAKDERILAYDTLPGCLEVRKQIAHLSLSSGTSVHPEDVITTTGCQEALSISLKAITKPGDVVAIESPSFYGLMQMLNALGLKALEIPTHPTEGISLDALELALDQWPVRAILVVPSFSNPLGGSMSDENKQRLLKLAQTYDLPIIEDDIYGELGYRQPRPKTIYSFDKEGRVILCSSFSKTLAVGLRVGWVLPGRYRERVLHMKYIGTASTVMLTQMAIAQFIEQGYYERHLRKMRLQYQAGRDAFVRQVQQYFPEETRASFPQGGFMLWLELPSSVDSIVLAQRMEQHRVKIAPGGIFSASGKYRNCIRLNYARGTEAAALEAVKLLGEEVKQMLTSNANGK
ncbi:PLP-dependent aminotransferase family protein [uncultured Thiothrix sp.]|uniref:aminotransferase-like domain-containing protein n=1 Tax=uncultured Thiothrix sp. TaxID=223185 RepID=UPI0026213A9E|nr:PLP-dependent aminotransferase family protein [uncultured Thiothrix sp.]